MLKLKFRLYYSLLSAFLLLPISDCFLFFFCLSSVCVFCLIVCVLLVFLLSVSCLVCWAGCFWLPPAMAPSQTNILPKVLPQPCCQILMSVHLVVIVATDTQSIDISIVSGLKSPFENLFSHLIMSKCFHLIWPCMWLFLFPCRIPFVRMQTKSQIFNWKSWMSNINKNKRWQPRWQCNDLMIMWFILWKWNHRKIDINKSQNQTTTKKFYSTI